MTLRGPRAHDCTEGFIAFPQEQEENVGALVSASEKIQDVPVLPPQVEPISSGRCGTTWTWPRCRNGSPGGGDEETGPSSFEATYPAIIR
jgi:hypothetical protein